MLAHLVLAGSLAAPWSAGHKLGPAARLGDVFSPPDSYTASLSFHLPYIPFSEPVSVVVDSKLGGGSMRLSYYSGLDTFIDTKSASSYKIVPVDDEFTCFNTTGCVDTKGDPADCTDKGAAVDPQWVHVFPNDPSLFSLQVEEADRTTPKTKLIQRCRRYAEQYSFDAGTEGRTGAYAGRHVERECAEPVGAPVTAHVWTYATTKPDKNGHVPVDFAAIKTVCDKDDKTMCEGWLGSYTFYTQQQSDGSHMPIRFAFTGHNVVLGGSHFDEYIMDYHSVTAGAVDPMLFDPPAGMECHPSDQPFGPTRSAATRDEERHPVTHPSAEIAMLFPGDHADRLREQTFAAYRAAHGKDYATPSETYERGVHFHRALRHINAHNRQRKSYWLKATHFADWSDAERAAVNGARWTDDKATTFAAHAAKNPHPSQVDSKIVSPEERARALPASVDWRKVPAYPGAKNRGRWTNPPKDQGTCGSCWSFGTTGDVEGTHFLKTGNLVSLSEQFLVSCDTAEDAGCNGGLDWEGFEWMIQNNTGRIATAASYGPTLMQEGFCHFDASAGKEQPVTLNGQVYKAEAAATISGWRTTAVFKNGTQQDGKISTLKSLILPISQTNLMEALATVGPISISVDASVGDFYYYGGGLFDNKACTSYELDHTVLAVGYGTDPATKKDYWIVKNSWSSYWGEEGFVRVARDGNICGVATTPNYVTGLQIPFE